MAPKKSKRTKTSTHKNNRRLPPDWLPRYSLEEANQLPEILYKVFAGGPASLPDIAKALKVAVKSTDFSALVSSALTYGTIIKEQGNFYSLSETGRKIVAPSHNQEAAEGRRKAALNPFIPALVYSAYNGFPLPSDDHLLNVLESQYEVPQNRVQSAATIILNNGVLAGIIQPSPSGGPYMVRLSSGSTTPTLVDPKFKEAEYPLIDVSNADWTKTCFYITPIGEDGTDVRGHADMMLTHLITPVLKQFELTPVRADRIERSGLITAQIFEYLVKARLCVADLSFSNPNVFYELGVRHVCKLPTIQIIRKGDKIPFDVAQGRTITVDTSNIYTIMDRMESAKRELTEHIKYFQSQNYQDSAKDNPVQVFLPDLKVSIPSK